MSKIFSIVSWIGTIILCAALLFFAYGGVFHTVIISGNSMYPTYNSGDLVVAMDQEEYVKGDVIVYHPDIDCARCNVVHRIIGGDDNGWITQGDNNDFVDPFRPTSADVYGKVIFHLNLFGLGMILANTQLWIFLFVLSIFIIYILYYKDWMRGSPDEKSDHEPDENNDDEKEQKEIEEKKEATKEPAKHKKKSKILSSFNGSAITASVLTLALVASAAPAIILTISTLGNYAKNRCTTATVSLTTVSATDNHLRVANIPASCNGLPITVRTLSPTAANQIQASGTISGTSINFSTVPALADPSQVTSSAVIIAGFGIPSTWTWTGGGSGPITGGGGSYNVSTTYTQTNGQQICVAINVTSTSETPVTWTAALRATGVPFNGDLNASHYEFNSNYNFGFVSNTPVNGIFTIQGKNGAETVSSGTPRSFSICNYSVPPPSGRDPNATYAISPGNGTNYTVPPGWYVCQTFTVSVTGAPIFYVGWDAVIDATPLFNAYHTQSGGTGTFKPPSAGDFTTTSLGGNLYKVAGIGWNTAGVRDGSPVQFTACWGG